MKNPIKRGDLVIFDLPVVEGTSVQCGRRVCLCIQNDRGNNYSPTTIVFPLTTKSKRNLPTHMLIKKDATNNLDKDSIVIGEQPTTVGESQFCGKIGHLTREQMREIDKIIKISLGVEA